MKYFIAVLFFININASYGQSAEELVDVNWNRTMGDYSLDMTNNIDSAIYYYGQYVDDTLYSNAKDKLSYANCWLRKGDARTFLEYVPKAILQGATLELIDNWHLDNKSYKGFVKSTVENAYDSLFQIYWKAIDTVAYLEIDKILQLDQYIRHYKPVDDEDHEVWAELLKTTDSLNFVRVKKLIEERGFPGYHTIGFKTDLLVPILMHITDLNDSKWEYIFSLLKEEVLKGNIMPALIALIADRHCQFNKDRTLFYGILPDAYPLFDCKNVDIERAKIGLSNLRKEYQLYRRVIPECYDK